MAGNIRRILIALILLLFQCELLLADESLLIVTDPWPPYSIKGTREIAGIDVEIVSRVLQLSAISVEFKTFPWKRCLNMVKMKKADAILDISITPERKDFLYFPEEPISEGVTVFFIKKEKKIPFTTLKDLNGLRVGAILGYSYCDEIDQADFTIKAERVGKLEQNFKKLLFDRIDFLIEVDLVGYYTAQQMGISDRIDIIPNASYCRGGNYLAFSKKPGHEQLSLRFGNALKAFKATDNYKQILKKYGIKVQ